MRTSPLLSLLVAAGLLAAGCATRQSEPEARRTGEEQCEYVLVQSIDSRIPRRIRIDQLSNATLRGAHPTSTVTGEDNIREVLSRPFPVSRGGR